MSEDYSVPDQVRGFVKSLTKLLRSRRISDLAQLYDQEWHKTTDRLFKSTAWPTVDQIAGLVDNDELTKMVYKELYYRHLHAKMQPTMEERFESFGNYLALFDALLGFNATQPEIELPNSWTWDMLDDFVSQFQSYHLIRNRPLSSGLTSEELKMLIDYEHMWSVQTVEQYLSAFVSKLNGESDNNDEAESKEVQASTFYQALGHYALVSLVRFNTLMGDYYGALQVMDRKDLVHKRSMFTKVFSCHLTLYYSMGFCYFMLRRYLDALKTVSTLLLYVSRAKHAIPRHSGQSVLLQRLERVWALLSLASAFAPQTYDDLQNDAAAKFGADRLARVQKLDTEALKEIFALAAPLFISPATPNYQDETANPNIFEQQLSVFLREVSQRLPISDCVAYLKLCTNISTTKLAHLLNVNEPQLVSNLLLVKHKTRNLRWRGGPPSRGEYMSLGEVEFSLAKDNVAVTQYSSARRYGDFFIRNILKFQEMIEDLTARPQREQQ